MPSILSPDLGLLFWMFLAFLIVFALVAKYGFPVIIKMVEDRKNYIDESLKKAREANEKLANIKAESEEILRQASERQAQVLKEAMATRDSIVKSAPRGIECRRKSCRTSADNYKVIQNSHPFFRRLRSFWTSEVIRLATFSQFK